MIRRHAAVALALMPVLTGGCVAAALPVVAGGMIARDQLRDKNGERSRKRLPRKAKAEAVPIELKTSQAQAVVRAAEAATAVPVPTLKALPPPSGGAGERAAHSLQGYQALWNHLAVQAAKRKRGEPLRSVVLAPGATLEAPGYLPCEAKPLTVVFDLDENPETSTDPDAQWRRWRGDGSDDLTAVHGAVEGVEAARREGVTVIFITARAPESAAGVAGVLDRLGFGAVEPGRTLFLRGGAAGGDRLRQSIAADHCVIALVGDALGDFSELFDAGGDAEKRPTAVTETMVAPLWGAGWFLLPNPVRSNVPPPRNPSEGVK